jgi:hypothetical protein
MTLLRLFALCAVILSTTLAAHLPVLAQATTQSHGSFDFNTDGVVFQATDSSTRVVMRFRMQNWAIYHTVPMGEDDEFDLSAGQTEFAVRRLRLRFGGSIVDPRLSFSSPSRDRTWTGPILSSRTSFAML